MPYTESQLNAIEVTERIGATLSFLGCSFMILTFLFSKRFHRPVNRIMFYASIGNLIYTIPGFIGLDGIKAGSTSSVCQAQAFIIEFALPGDALWNLCMALNVYFTVFKGNDMSRLQKREPWYIAFNTLVPLVVAMSLLFSESVDQGRVYGNAAIWCWISSEWEWLRILTCYGPAWVCIVLAFSIYIAAGLRIRRERMKLLRPSIEHGPYGEAHLTNFDIVAQTTVQTEVAHDDDTITTVQPPSTMASLKSPAGSSVRHFSSSYKPSNRSRYQVHISTSVGRPEAMVYSDPVRKYTKSCILFFISLLITWVPSSINRVWSLTHPGEAAPFGLAYIAALVLQLTGFWNSVVYITMSRASCRELFVFDILPFITRRQPIVPHSPHSPHTPSSRPKTPLTWHDSMGEAMPMRNTRRVSIDTTSSSAQIRAPPLVKTSEASSEVDDSITSWDWNNKRAADCASNTS